MKLLSYKHKQKATYGALVNGGVVDLGARVGEKYADIKAVIAHGVLQDICKDLDRAPVDHQLSEIEFVPVIENPSKILCVGVNYESHRKEMGRDKFAYPTIFTRFADTQMGHERPTIMPKVSDCLDYEGELAVVIGKAGRYISREDAMSHVAGYSCYNDITLRDWQRHTAQFTPGKNFPNSGALGPYLVSADEIEDVHKLDIQTRLNGEVMQNSNTEMMIFDIPSIIEYLSGFTPLSTW